MISVQNIIFLTNPVLNPETVILSLRTDAKFCSEIVGLLTETLATTLHSCEKAIGLLSADVGFGVERIDNGSSKLFFEFTRRSRVVLTG